MADDAPAYGPDNHPPLTAVDAASGDVHNLNATGRALLVLDAPASAFTVDRTFTVRANSVIPTTVRKTTDNGASYTNYTTEATDGNAATHVALSSLDTLVNGDWLVVGASQTFRGLDVDMDAAVNGTVSVMAVHYWNGTAWTALTIVDGTASGGATFAQDGNVTWTEPTDWAQNTIDGVTAYHVRITVSVALDASTDLDALLCLGATELLAASAARKGFMLVNNGGTLCYWGGPDVVSGATEVAAGGKLLSASGGAVAFQGGPQGRIRAITAAGTTVVAVCAW